MKIVVISGTPGTGKTSVSKAITEKIGGNAISLNEISVSKRFTLQYDEKRSTYVVDFNQLLPYIISLINSYKKENLPFLIIEGHFSDIIPNKFIDYAIVLRCHPDELTRRLQMRDYDNKKIQENIQSEILGNSINYFIQKKIRSPLIEIDTTSLSIEELSQIIIEIIVENKHIEQFTIGTIDWLEELFQKDRLNEFFT